jgi:hypothetical protein
VLLNPPPSTPAPRPDASLHPPPRHHPQGFGWVWDRACYSPVTGQTTAGGGGFYQNRRLQWAPWAGPPAVTPAGLADGVAEDLDAWAAEPDQFVGAEGVGGSGGGGRSEDDGGWLGVGRRLMGAVVRPGWTTAAPGRSRDAILAPPAPPPKVNTTYGLSAAAAAASGSANGSGAGAGGDGSTVSSAATYGGGGTGTRRRVPNVVYTAAVGAVAQTIRSQAPPGSRVIRPPPGEVAAAALKPESVTPDAVAAAAAAAARLDGSWSVEAAGKYGSNKDKTAHRDVYMSTAYYNPQYRSWQIEFRCRFRKNWNERNKVTLLATVVKSGVITYGSAATEAENPLGLAYPQVAVRGGTMLITYTYCSYTNIPVLPGVRFTDVPAYPGACVVC